MAFIAPVFLKFVLNELC